MMNVRLFTNFVCCQIVIIVALVSFFESFAIAESVDKFERALITAVNKKRPLLLYVYMDGWPHCPVLEQQLQTTACLQLVRQYIPVKIDLRHKESKQLVSEFFNVKLDGAPTMLLIGSNMKLLDKTAGVSSQPPTSFLREGLNQQRLGPKTPDLDTVNILNNTKTRIILRSIESAIENENIAGAVKTLRSASKYSKSTDSDSQMNQALSKVIDRLHQNALKDLDRSRDLLSEEQSQFQGLLLMAHTIRSYSGLPEMKKILAKEKQALESMAKNLSFSAQIKSIDKARSLEERGKKDKALKMYRGIMSRYSGSQAENFCKQRISALEKK